MSKHTYVYENALLFNGKQRIFDGRLYSISKKNQVKEIEVDNRKETLYRASIANYHYLIVEDSAIIATQVIRFLVPLTDEQLEQWVKKYYPEYLETATSFAVIDDPDEMGGVLTIRLKLAIKMRIVRMAIKKSMSLSKLIRVALEEYLDRHEKE